jgi:hypothetical protein
VESIVNEGLDAVNVKFSDRWSSVVDRIKLKAEIPGAIFDFKQQ